MSGPRLNYVSHNLSRKPIFSKIDVLFYLKEKNTLCKCLEHIIFPLIINFNFFFNCTQPFPYRRSIFFNNFLPICFLFFYLFCLKHGWKHHIYCIVGCMTLSCIQEWWWYWWLNSQKRVASGLKVSGFTKICSCHSFSIVVWLCKFGMKLKIVKEYTDGVNLSKVNLYSPVSDPSIWFHDLPFRHTWNESCIMQLWNFNWLPKLL